MMMKTKVEWLHSLQSCLLALYRELQLYHSALHPGKPHPQLHALWHSFVVTNHQMTNLMYTRAK